METAYSKYFEKNMRFLENAIKTVSLESFETLVNDCATALKAGNKIIASGLGKNVPMCEKFVGTMLSLGLDAGFLHTNSAVHGDMGMVKSGDVVIILSKSGATEESVYLYDLLKERGGIVLWLLSCKRNSFLAERMDKKIIVELEHEGDMWDIVPNNSTVLNLLILQELAMAIAWNLNLELEKDFKPNHPGGDIGARLKNE